MKPPRSRRGFSSVEVSISCALMICVVALALDLTLLNFATAMNDAACRDAARAAAQCNNSASALQAAQIQMKMHATDGFFISQPTLTSTSSPDFVYEDYAGDAPEDTSPYVTVTTSVNVRMPCPIVFFGSSFYGPGGTIVFKRQYSFPIIKEKFYG